MPHCKCDIFFNMDAHNVFDVSVTDHILAITFNDFIYFYDSMSKSIEDIKLI